MLHSVLAKAKAGEQLAPAESQQLALALEHVVDAIDRDMVNTCMGVFAVGQDAHEALHHLGVWHQDVGEYFALRECKPLTDAQQALVAAALDLTDCEQARVQFELQRDPRQLELLAEEREERVTNVVRATQRVLAARTAPWA